MATKHRFDFMIVGQGLAGCLLARALTDRGASCLLVGKELPLAATPVAAGIMNPVTGKRLAKSWKAETFIPAAKKFYRDLGHAWNQNLLHEGRILRFPAEEKELDRFRRRKSDPEFDLFLGNEFPPNHWSQHGWKDDIGSYEIQGVGWVAVERIAARIRQHYLEEDVLREENFAHDDLMVSSAGCKWRGEEAQNVVFCEGAKVMVNPWFREVPFAPSRGETLDLENRDAAQSQILQSEFWLLSSPDGSLRAGSTYDHDDLASGPTEKGRKKILDGLSRFLRQSSSVVGQRCGLRPGTRDRLPVMGRHPEHPNVALFNGFGSKGASWIPLLAKNFADHLLNEKPLDPEVNLLRFAKDKNS
jgi:glycine oxidase